MFLNWVYWKNNPVAAETGFLDKLWRGTSGGNYCYPEGCDDSGESGLVRSEWMDQTMSALFTQFGW